MEGGKIEQKPTNSKSTYRAKCSAILIRFSLICVDISLLSFFTNSDQSISMPDIPREHSASYRILDLSKLLRNFISFFGQFLEPWTLFEFRIFISKLEIRS